MVSNPSVKPKPSLADATGSSDACCARTVLIVEVASSNAHAIPLLRTTEKILTRVMVTRDSLDQGCASSVGVVRRRARPLAHGWRFVAYNDERSRLRRKR